MMMMMMMMMMIEREGFIRSWSQSPFKQFEWLIKGENVSQISIVRLRDISNLHSDILRWRCFDTPPSLHTCSKARGSDLTTSRGLCFPIIIKQTAYNTLMFALCICNKNFSFKCNFFFTFLQTFCKLILFRLTIDQSCTDFHTKYVWFSGYDTRLARHCGSNLHG